MKLCPNCKAELDDHARFCLRCMTSLEEKEQIQPPVRKVRRWPLVLLCVLLSCALVLFLVLSGSPTPEDDTESSLPTAELPAGSVTQTVDSVIYTFRPATGEDHPTAVVLDNHYVLIRVEGAPSDGIYRVPAFVDGNMSKLVTVVADGAFAGTNARAIDLGYNVRYVWGNAFGGYCLTDLHLHTDVRIDRAAFSGCGDALTIHCPEYLENTEGLLWSDLAASYGFRWQPEVF